MTRVRTGAGRHTDLALVLAAGIVTCLAVNLIPDATAVRAVFAIPFLLLGVGYLIMVAAFGNDLPDGSLQVLLVPALSIAGVILMALGLDVAKFPLNARAFADAALVLAGVTAAIAGLRRRGQEVSLPRLPVRAAARSRWTWSLLLAAAVFAALLIVLARPLPDSHIAGYTALSSLRGPGSSVRVEVQSAETRTVAYRLAVLPDSGPAQTRSFTLKPGERWAQLVSLSGPPLQIVRVRLYRTAEPTTVYRQVFLKP